MPNAPTAPCPRPPKRPYLVVAHLADGPRLTAYDSKRDARVAGMALRRAGVVAFAFPVELAQRFGHDARVALRGAA